MSSSANADGVPIQRSVRSAAVRLAKVAQQLISGPVNSLYLGPGRAEWRNTKSRWRSTHIVIDRAYVLAHRLVLPKEAAAEIAQAAELLVTTRTPFRPQEVLLHVSAAPLGHEDIAVEVRLLPRNLVTSGLAAAGARLGQVAEITIDQPQASEAAVDFATALNPTLRWRRWLSLAPCVALLLAANFALSGLEARRDREMAGLEAQLNLARVDLGKLADEAVLRREAKANAVARDEQRKRTLSLHEVINFVARTVPASADLQRIEGRSGQVRLWTEASDIVSLVEEMNRGGVTWKASVDGAISVTPTSGKQAATVLLRAN